MRCKEKFDDYGNEVYGKHQATRDPQSLPFRNEVTMGKVLFSFREEKDNELGVEEGDIFLLENFCGMPVVERVPAPNHLRNSPCDARTAAGTARAVQEGSAARDRVAEGRASYSRGSRQR